MLATALVLGLCLTGCVPRPEHEIVLYSAADREVAAPIISAFQRRHAETQVNSTFDVESTKTVGLVTRIENESTKPRCDLFWNNEILHTLRLEQAGMLRPVAWDVPRDWPVTMRSSNGSWIAFAAHARVLLVNRKQLPDQNEWPNSVMELSDPKWHKRCAVASPLFGTTATHFTVLQTLMGDDKAEAWFREVKQNAVVLAGNKQVAQAVAAGQVAMGLTDTDDALLELDNSNDVTIVFPDQQSEQLGTLLIPNTLCVLKDCPHPNAATTLGNYLLSEDIEGRLAMGQSGNIPVRPGHPQQSRAAPPKTIHTMEADFSKAAASGIKLRPLCRAIYRGD